MQIVLPASRPCPLRRRESCDPQDQPHQVYEVSGDKNCDGKRHFNKVRDEDPHPVTLENFSARAGIEIGLDADIEKPFRATQQRLMPATISASDAGASP